jgi:hypothetical protein
MIYKRQILPVPHDTAGQTAPLDGLTEIWPLSDVSAPDFATHALSADAKRRFASGVCGPESRF